MPATATQRLDERVRQVATWVGHPAMVSLYLDVDGTDELARRHLSRMAAVVADRLRQNSDESLILGGPETRIIDRVVASMEAGDALVGLEATLTALGLARVELLLVASGYHAPGGRCPQCGRLAAASRPCPRCGAATDPVDDVVAAAIAAELSEGAAVRVVGEDQRMRQLDDIAALLRY
jgi:peptide subunit release factor 1 (eRF1)